MSRRLKDALLERHLAGDLPGPLRAEVEAALAASPEDRARLEELRADSAAFLVQHPPGPLAARAEEAAARKRRLRWLWALAPVAATVVLVLLVRLASVDRGGIELVVYAGQGQPVASAGDAVRFLLRARSVGYVAVVGRAADGSVRVYHPEGADEASAYDPGQPALPGATRLAPGEEEVFGLFCPAPFKLGPALDALRRRAPLQGALPQGCLSARVPVTGR